MSEDEEIIIKGNSLDNYLTDLGYADFETFELENKSPQDEHFLSTHQAGKTIEGVSVKVSTYSITEHEYRKLKSILNSQLLLKEDAHVIDSVLQNAHVYHQRTNYGLHSSVIAVGLLSSALLFKSKFNLCVVPVGLSMLFSCYSFWQYSNEIKEIKKDVALETHINDLQKLCLNILQFIRFINETEVLSTTQFPVNNRSALYVSSKFEFRKGLDPNTEPESKSLPHLRKCLSDVVEEALSLISTSVISSRQYDRHIELDNSFSNSPCQSSDRFSPFSVTELKSLISTYLAAQSEYLTKVALTLSSVYSKDSLDWHSVFTFNLKCAKEGMFENFSGLHKKLSNMSFKLNMQRNMHNIPATVRQISSEDKCFINKSREIIEMQNGVHNVFLLLYSTLLRVRSLEDSLEIISRTNSSCKSTEQLSLDLIEHLTILKDDFKRTTRCYEVLCQQATLKTIAVDHKQQSEEEGRPNVNHKKVIETGIVVGNSDFKVGSQDEVFLSLSGVNDKEILMSENFDDDVLERKPQIPKSLISELAHTLKSRKVNFIEREKQALKRKGLEDVDDLSFSESSGRSDNKSEPRSRARNRGQIKYKKHIFAQDSHSSDSDDEMDPFESGAFLTKLKMCKKYQSDPYSDTDSSVVEFEHNKIVPENQIASEIGVNSSVLAELVASKSQLWGRTNEECFSDGSGS